LRAAVSLLALVGFYVFAIALFGGVIYGAYALSDHIRMMWWIIAITVGAALVFVGTVVSEAFAEPRLPAGYDVTPEQAPELWSLVGELAAAARTRGPKQIRLVATVRAAVDEDSKLLGLIGGDRRIYLGVPLLQGLTVTQLRAALAHEFGHYSSAHTRLGPSAYRGWAAVLSTVQQMQGPDIHWAMRLYQWPLRVYAVIYILVSMAMSRSQEREADRLMVQLAGRANAQSALREVDVLGNWWAAYERDFLWPGWNLDLAPTAASFFDGFPKLLTARADEVAEMRSAPARSEGSPLDTHPPTALRIATIGLLPDRDDAPPEDVRPASDLIRDFGAVAAITAERSYVFGYRERLDVEDLRARMWAIESQDIVNRVYPIAGRLASDRQPTLATVAALAADGRSAELANAVAQEEVYRKHAEEVRERFEIQLFTTLVRVALVQSEAVRWRGLFSAPALVTGDGEEVDTKSIAALLADAATTHEAVARLSALGVDVAAVGPTAMTPTIDVGNVLGGISGMTSDDATYDVLIADKGLILAANPGPAEQGGWGSLEELIGSSSTSQLVVRHRYVPYESMKSAKVSGVASIKTAITLRDGAKLELKEAATSERKPKTSAETLLKNHLERVGR
jgi:Zn-dependent protease with chaperone function